MRRYFYFWDHFNLARLSIFDDVDIVLTGEETTVNLRPLTILWQQTTGFALVVAALPTYIGEFR